jgi:uncharacterized protein (TIGR03437 family)
MGQKILYTTSQDGNNEIYVMNVDGSAVTRLTNTPEDEYSPRWSADGSAIYFGASLNGLAAGSYGVNADGTGRTPAPWPGEWSPDGLMELNLTQDGLAIRGIDDFGDPTFLAEGGVFGNLRWAPDSFRILFSWSPEGMIFPYAGLYVTTAYGGQPRRIIGGCPAGCAVQEASWSPDGSKILVVKEDAILVFAADGGADPEPLFTLKRQVYDAAWSPDGSQIAYITMGINPSQAQLFKVSSSGGSQELVIDGPVGVEYTQLRYAPDGSKILLDNPYSALWDNHGPAAIYSVDADGKNWRVLAVEAQFDDIRSSAAAASPTVYENGIILSNLAPAVRAVSSLAIASIFGSGLAAGSSLHAIPEAPYSISTKRLGSCVEIGGVRAPILAITPTQINVQVPSLQSLGPVSVAVIRNCDMPGARWSNAVIVTMEEATPAFFLYPPYKSGGWIAARHASDNGIVAPADLYLESLGPSRPARPGDVISLYGTGWGATTANLSTGERASGPTPLLSAANAQVTFGGIALAPENVLYVGAAPGYAGLSQLNIRVPANAAPGANSVVLTVYGKSTPAGPVVPVMTVAP